MSVRELVFRGEDETKLFACGKCGNCFSVKNVGRQNARDMAEKCCEPMQYTCTVCGIEVPHYRTMCQHHAELGRLRKAVPIDDAIWTDPVEFDGLPGGWGEGYFPDTQDLRDACEDHEVPVPAYCWPCTATPLALNAERILESAVEEMHEDAADQIVDADELWAFIDAWNAKQTCQTWHPDTKRVVVLDPERFAALLADEPARATAPASPTSEGDET